MREKFGVERQAEVKNSMRQDLILVGRFGAPHGVRGEIRLQSFTEHPESIADYGPLCDARAERQFVVESLRPAKDDLFVAKLRGIETRSNAQALTNTELFLPRASLPDLAPEEFYLADLIGLEVVTEARARFGRIVAVPDFGGGPLLEIEQLESHETLLLPFTKTIVPIVDLVAARVVVRPPIEVVGEETESIEPGPGFVLRRRT